MKKIILLVYHFFKSLFRLKPKPKEYSSLVYQTTTEKSEPENNSELSKSISQFSSEPFLAMEVQSPMKIHRTDDYSPIKNLNTKKVIQAERVSREDALRLSNLPLTNDMSEIGDDTVKVPMRSGHFLYITPEPVMADENYKKEREKFLIFINTVIEQSKEDK